MTQAQWKARRAFEQARRGLEVQFELYGHQIFVAVQAGQSSMPGIPSEMSAAYTALVQAEQAIVAADKAAAGGGS